MPRTAKAKTAAKDSTTQLEFDGDLGLTADTMGGLSVRWQWSGATATTRQGCPEGERGGVHQFGVPPKGNANFAWVQHFIHHLAPQTALRDSASARREASPQVVSAVKDNMVGVDFVCLRFAPAVLANGSMSSNQSGEGDIRRVGRKFCPGRTALCSAN